MSICVISPKVAEDSAKKLADALKAEYVNPFEKDLRDFTKYNVVFNYGCNRNIEYNEIVNTQQGVARCIDKVKTLYHLSRLGFPCVNYARKKEDIPSFWESIAVRGSSTGNNSDSIEYVDKGENIPDAELYTEYCPYEIELRVIVFKGGVIARYHKHRRKDNTWKFVKVSSEGFKTIDKTCIDAAEVLKIDYVGFDLLAKNKKIFKILEANSAPMITPTIIKHIKGKLNETMHSV